MSNQNIIFIFKIFIHLFFIVIVITIIGCTIIGETKRNSLFYIPCYGDETFQKAEQLYMKRSYSQAIDLYVKYLSCSTKKAFEDKAMFKIGQIYTIQGKYDQAAEVYKQLIQKYPDSILSSRVQLGLIYNAYSQKEYEKALQQVEPAHLVTHKKDHSRLYLLKGDILLALNRPQESVVSYTYAFEIANQNELPLILTRSIQAISILTPAELQYLISVYQGRFPVVYMLYQKAQNHIKYGNMEKGLESLQNIVINYPDHEMIPKIQDEIETLENKKFPKRISVLPPVLKIKSISFSKKVLNCNETAELSITLENIGPGEAKDIEAVVTADTKGIVVADTSTFPKIKANNGLQSITVPVKATMAVPNARASLNIQIIDPHFNVKIQGKRLFFSTRAFKRPNLQLVQFAVVENVSPYSNQRVDTNEIVDVKCAIQNLGKGPAEQVEVGILNNQKGLIFLGRVDKHSNTVESPIKFSRILPGKYKTIIYRYFINSELVDNILRFNVWSSEKHNKYGFQTIKSVPVNTKLEPEGFIKPYQTREPEKALDIEIEDVPDFIAEVDQKLPKTNMENASAVAIIIGNRDYEKTSSVEFAINDALIIKRYLKELMGYQESNIDMLKNASKGDFETYFGTADNYRGKLYNYVGINRKPDVFIYYSGHGAFGEKNKKTFFVPVETDPQYPELGGYPTNTFYKNLSYIQANSFTIVLDCCFSGAKRVSPMYQKWFHDSSIKIPNATLMTSSKGTQYSSWYTEKNHSLFTYFFLKGIHSKRADLNNDNRISIKELFEYLSNKATGVPYYSRRLNNVEQTPTMSGDGDRILVNYK
jgi:tetratricopeptide (TPR) repeat protein